MFPPQHRRLQGDAEQGGEVEVRRAPERTQRLIGDEERGDADTEKNAVVFGEDREPEQGAAGIEPAEAGPVGLPFFGEDEEGVRGGDAKEDQQMIVERDAAHQEIHRRGEVDRSTRPPPGARILRLQPLRPQPEDPQRAGEGEPSEDAQREIVPAEHADDAQQPGMQRRMIEIGPVELLAPHPVIGFVADRRRLGGQVDLDQQQDRDRGLREADGRETTGPADVTAWWPSAAWPW